MPRKSPAKAARDTTVIGQKPDGSPLTSGEYRKAAKADAAKLAAASYDPDAPRDRLISARIPEALYLRLEAAAQAESRTLANMIRVTLGRGLLLKPAYPTEMSMADAIAADNAMDKRPAPKRRAKR